MNSQIVFKISYDKAVEIIVWLAQKKPGIDIYHVVKILFFADKMHINKYARPVVGDTYVKMPYGPMPSGISDLIKENTWLSPDQLAGIRNAVDIDKEANYKLTAKREPDLTYFSKSDLACLKAALEKYGDMDFRELYCLTHREKCYCSTDDQSKIDYALFVDDKNPLKNEILSDMAETSRYVQV